MSRPDGLAALIEARRTMDGVDWYGHPFSFAEWLKGATEFQRSGQGRLT